MGSRWRITARVAAKMTDAEPPSPGASTLVAAMTPIGAAGIAVVRMVGPNALRIVEQVFEPGGRGPRDGRIEPGRVVYGRIVDNGRVIDDVVVTARPQSGRRGGSPSDLVEINPHGGVRVVQRVLMLLVRQGACLTDPHEIGALGWPANSAIEPEVWSSLIQAQTHRAAMWLANQQTILPALLRDCIDRLASPGASDVGSVVEELKRLSDCYEPARRLVEGAGIAIAGAPNAGKSTLANRLFGQSRSLVTEQPGTTRDWVAEPAAVEGVPIVLIDTAGLRWSDDPIERAAIERGLGRIASADLVLVVLDRSEPIGPMGRYAMAAVAKRIPPDRTLLVLNKCDLPDRLGGAPSSDAGWVGEVRLSATTGEGEDRLGQALCEALGFAGWSDQTPAVWTRRQKAGIDRAMSMLPDRPAEAASALRDVVEM